MSSARAFRVRALRLGAAGALTLAASGLMAAGTTSAASADVFCDYAGVSTFATGSVSTPPVCFTTQLPYLCDSEAAGVGTTVNAYADYCVID